MLSLKASSRPSLEDLEHVIKRKKDDHQIILDLEKEVEGLKPYQKTSADLQKLSDTANTKNKQLEIDKKSAEDRAIKAEADLKERTRELKEAQWHLNDALTITTADAKTIEELEKKQKIDREEIQKLKNDDAVQKHHFQQQFNSLNSEIDRMKNEGLKLVSDYEKYVAEKNTIKQKLDDSESVHLTIATQLQRALSERDSAIVKTREVAAILNVRTAQLNIAQALCETGEAQLISANEKLQAIETESASLRDQAESLHAAQETSVSFLHIFILILL